MEQQILDVAREIAEAFYDEHYIFFWLLGLCATVVAGAVPAFLIPMWIRVTRILELAQANHKGVAKLIEMHNNADSYGFGTTMTNVAIKESTKVLTAINANLLKSDTTLNRLADMIDKEQERRERQDELQEQLRMIRDAKNEN